MKLNEIKDPAQEFLEKNRVKNYTINPNGTVDVAGDVNITTKQSKFPVKFGRITGHFMCWSCRLTSLEGAPSHVGGYFDCNYNKLASLVGAPSDVGGYFSCFDNKLTSLKGAPSHVGGYFNCDNNHLTSLEGAPSYVGGYFDCECTNLTSLHDVHKHLKEVNGWFYCNDNHIEDSVLGLLLVKGVKGVNLDNEEVRKILNKYLEQGRAGVIGAQQELLDAGLDKYAKL